MLGGGRLVARGALRATVPLRCRLLREGERAPLGVSRDCTTVGVFCGCALPAAGGATGSASASSAANEATRRPETQEAMRMGRV